MPILFTEEKPNVYLKSQIFDPDTNPNGQIIPRVGSLVIDTPNGGTIYWVESVDDTTFKSTLIIAKTALLAPSDKQPEDNESFIIDYGNTIFNLFFDPSTHPKHLSIDKKLIIVSNDAYYYKLYKFNDNSNSYEVISSYYDNNTNQYIGESIPLISTAVNNVKGFPDCYTMSHLENGDSIFIRIFNKNDNQVGEIVTIAKEGVISSPIIDPPIIDFYLSATQEINDKFYLYPDQSLDTLMITPILVYENGQEVIAPIDNNICYMYSDLQYFVPSFPGQKAKVLIKYFLSPNQNVQPNQNIQVYESNGLKYLTISKDIIVLDNEEVSYDVKISVIPTFITSANTWKLYFYLYTVDGNLVKDITDDVDVKVAFAGESDYNREFNGQEYNHEQILKITYDLKLAFPMMPTSLIHEQTTAVKLSLPTEFIKYTIRDPGDDIGDGNNIIYGIEGGSNNRPILRYDTNNQKYQIPLSPFVTKEKMLEDFYYKANPPYPLNETNNDIPMPSHFTIRDILTGGLLLSSPVDIESNSSGYLTEFSTTTINPNDLVGTNCIVEFLKYDVANDIFLSIYGVPVDVY